MDLVITGASRGIGRALTQALAARATPETRLYLLARDSARLDALVRDLPGARLLAVPVDLSHPDAARAAAERLAEQLTSGAVLVHNAGLWPTRRELVDGVEAAYAVNCLGALALQEPLLDAGKLARVMLVGAGLMKFGRFDATRTPRGDDFGRMKTYCNTKLAGAIAMRAVARRHADVDIMVVHPGVVETELGLDEGWLSRLVRLVKRRWETPEACAARLVRLLDRPRWQHQPGDAPWFNEEREEPWPTAAERDETAVLGALGLG